jgi:excisionase family DNA binding protein
MTANSEIERTTAAVLLLTVEEAAQRLSIGRTTMYSLVSAGVIKSVTIGRLRRIPSECLDEYVSGLRTSGQPESAAALVGGDRDGTKREWPVQHL